MAQGKTLSLRLERRDFEAVTRFLRNLQENNMSAGDRYHFYVIYRENSLRLEITEIVDFKMPEGEKHAL